MKDVKGGKGSDLQIELRNNKLIGRFEGEISQVQLTRSAHSQDGKVLTKYKAGGKKSSLLRECEY